MKLYGGMDLHSTNVVTQLIDEQDKVIYRKKQGCDLEQIVRGLETLKDDIEGLAVESTYNWYWLVDGLIDAGYCVHLVNTAAVKQYEGLKYTDDDSDAFWLAHLLRLGILPTGYIYPKQSRAVRDLLRKRGQLVRQRTAHVLSIENLYTRNTGSRPSCNAVKALSQEQIQQQFGDPNVALAIDSNRVIMTALDQQIKVLEQAILKQAQLDDRYRYLLTISGVGQVLALTIMLETGAIERFAQVGNFTSYCRCVGSEKLSNGKKKGHGNSKNAKSSRVVALKAVAHKLARASFYVMRDQVPFDSAKLFM